MGCLPLLRVGRFTSCAGRVRSAPLFVFVCACACACARARVCACAPVRVCACAPVRLSFASSRCRACLHVVICGLVPQVLVPERGSRSICHAGGYFPPCPMRHPRCGCVWATGQFYFILARFCTCCASVRVGSARLLRLSGVLLCGVCGGMVCVCACVYVEGDPVRSPS